MADPDIEVAASDSTRAATTENAALLASPPCPVDLTDTERALWQHICEQLTAAGMVHLTAGLAISVIVKKYARWVDAQAQVEQLDSLVIKTPNGYEQPHQLVYLVGRLENELLKWLPQAALTIPSFAKVRSLEKGENQMDMFAREVLDALRGRPE